jgi:hypothetical protein
MVTPDLQEVLEVVDKDVELESVVVENGCGQQIFDGINSSVPPEGRKRQMPRSTQLVGVFSQGKPNLKQTTVLGPVVDTGVKCSTKQGFRGRSPLYPLLEGHRDYRVETLGEPKRKDGLVEDGEFVNSSYPTAWGKSDKDGKRGFRRGAKRCRPPDHSQA